jgi:Carboxypeptidase regulatory-like domain/TonB dependent receptor-like, beta-barrel
MVRMKPNVIIIFLCALALVSQVLSSSTPAQGVTSSIKGTVSATAADPSASPELLPGAQLTLVDRDLPDVIRKTITDETGNFAFLDLPAANYKLTAGAHNLPSVSRDVRLTTGATLAVEIILTASLNESVIVREEEGLLSTAETSTSNTIRADKLEALPLRAENYQSALPLTPGVVRGMDGADHIKGTRSGQSSYTVNGADVTDPVSGNLAFDIPLEAAASVHIEENPYSAEVGRSTGGATNLESKTGGDKFKIGLDRIFPTFHNFISGKLDSFRPRLTLSGPFHKRLRFVQSLEYRFTRTYVPSLSTPHNDTTSTAFNSFTQLDFTVNQQNSFKFVGAFFPQKLHFVGLNTFNPQGTTPNTRQSGVLLSVIEQAIFHDGSFLSSLVSYKTFEFDVSSQGPQPLTILPDGNTGNYFANSHRLAKRFQWQENYFAHPLKLGGEHSLKLGAEFDYATLSASFDFRPILIRRGDGTLSERIDFLSPKLLDDHSLGEFGAFVQDRWVISQSLTIDAGLRLDRDTVAQRANLSPRLAVMYRPFKDDRTVVRAGIGIFYDRSPMSSKYFEPGNLDANDQPLNTSVLGTVPRTHFPRRVVTTFAPDGLSIEDGPRPFENAIKDPLRNARSKRWSLQIDRGLTKHLTTRIGYIQRSTVDEPIIEPRQTKSGGVLILKSRGRSQYHELQALVAYNSGRFHNWNVAYVWSRARGDLNTAADFLGDFPALVILPNQYGPLPFDAPHRFLAYGEIAAPYGLTVTPTLEIRSGFPFSWVDDRLEFVGARNQAGRFPVFMSLDLQILKAFKIPFLDKRIRAGAAIFNITNHFNPRDYQNNTGSLHFGEFFNSLGPSVRAKFEMNF